MRKRYFPWTRFYFSDCGSRSHAMASSSKQSETRDLLIPLPKYTPGPQPSIIGWSFQVQSILEQSKGTFEVKSPFLLNALPAEVLTKVFGLKLENKYRNWLFVLRDLREYFKDPDTEIEYYNSLQAPTKTVPLWILNFVLLQLILLLLYRGWMNVITIVKMERNELLPC